MQHKVIQDSEERMKKALESVKHEMVGVRTGKASPSLLDTVKVEAYGSHVPIQQVGTVSAPEARLLYDETPESIAARAASRDSRQVVQHPTGDIPRGPTKPGPTVRRLRSSGCRGGSRPR